MPAPSSRGSRVRSPVEAGTTCSPLRRISPPERFSRSCRSHRLTRCASGICARAVGVDVERAQWVILAGSSLFAASSVVLAGLVGFIGLIVPHLARRIAGSNAVALLPACAAIGAALCMLADAVCRSIVAPAELPIGVLLAFIGVPTFLYLYLRPATAAARSARR